MAGRVRDHIGQPSSRTERWGVTAFVLVHTVVYFALAFFVHYFVSLPAGWGGEATLSLVFYLVTIGVSMGWHALYATLHFLYPPSNDVRRESQLTLAVALGGLAVTVGFGVATGVVFLGQSVFTGVFLLTVIALAILVYSTHLYRHWDRIAPMNMGMPFGAQGRAPVSVPGVRSAAGRFRTPLGGG